MKYNYVKKFNSEVEYTNFMSNNSYRFSDGQFMIISFQLYNTIAINGSPYLGILVYSYVVELF